MWPFKQPQVLTGWAPCIVCRKPRPDEELSPDQVCVECWIRSGTEKTWHLESLRPRGVEEWSESAEQVQGLAMVTRHGEEGRRHVLTSLHGAFNLTHLGLLTVRVGEGGLKVKTYCFNQRDMHFGRLVIPVGEAVSAGLNFRGDTRNLPDTAAATVLLIGFTIDAEE